MAGLEAGPDLVFMIGYHAKAQTRGLLAHTINSSAFARVVLDGRDVGEAGLYGALAHEYGAHVALLSGDDVFVDETRPLFPAAQFVTVKEAAGFASGASMTPAAACGAIGVAARQAVEQAREGARGAPACAARGALRAAGAERRGRRPVLSVAVARARRRAHAALFAPSIEHVVRTLNCLSAMSFMLR